MFYLFLRFVVSILYVGGFFLLYLGIVNTYFGASIYLLIFIIHIIHWKRYKKESERTPKPLFILDILLFGMIPILEIKNKKV